MRVLIAAALLLLAGCSMSADTKLAEQAVTQFHSTLDAGQFDSLYEHAADDLKNSTQRERFVAFVDAVHRKLGTYQSSTEKNWNISYHPTGTYVTLSYTSTYAGGEANEEFVYRLEGQSALLAGYHVNSDALILK